MSTTMAPSQTQCEAIDQGYSGERRCHFKARYTVDGHRYCKLHNPTTDMRQLMKQANQALLKLSIKLEEATAAVEHFQEILEQVRKRNEMVQ